MADGNEATENMRDASHDLVKQRQLLMKLFFYDEEL